MPKPHILLILCLILASCHSEKKVNLEIPAQVPVQQSKTASQFPGTGVFFTKPAGFTFNDQQGQYDKNDSTFIRAYELREMSFASQRDVIKKSVREEQEQRKLANIYFEKEFKLGSWDALLYYAAGEVPDRDNFVLYFGNDRFCVMLSAEIPANNIAARDEMLKAILTAYEDTSVKAEAATATGPNYTLSVAGTQYKYIGYSGEFYLYTAGSKSDDTHEIMADLINLDRIIVRPVPPVGKNALKEYALNTLATYKQYFSEVKNITQEEITYKGNYAFEVRFKCTYMSRPLTVYQMVTANARGGVLYQAYVHDDNEELMRQAMQVMSTLKIR